MNGNPICATFWCHGNHVWFFYAPTWQTSLVRKHPDGPDPNFGGIANHKNTCEVSGVSPTKINKYTRHHRHAHADGNFAWQPRHGSISPEPESLSGGWRFNLTVTRYFLMVCSCTVRMLVVWDMVEILPTRSSSIWHMYAAGLIVHFWVFDDNSKILTIWQNICSFGISLNRVLRNAWAWFAAKQ